MGFQSPVGPHRKWTAAICALGRFPSQRGPPPLPPSLSRRRRRRHRLSNLLRFFDLFIDGHVSSSLFGVEFSSLVWLPLAATGFLGIVGVVIIAALPPFDG